MNEFLILHVVLGSIVVSIPACHAGDRGSIPRRGGRNSLPTIAKLLEFISIK
jgi:hypothetical protein